MLNGPIPLPFPFVKALQQSAVKRFYRRDLAGPSVETPLRVQGWYEAHRSCCRHCQSFGDWSFVVDHNAENECYIADILAILHHGYLVPFQSLPQPFDKGENYPTLLKAREAVSKEWAKMVDNHVVFPVQPGSPRPVCLSPLQAVVKQSDVEDAVAELGLRGWSGELSEPAGDPSDGYYVFDEAEGCVDELNGALEASGSTLRVKARLCVDNSVTTNKVTIKVPFAYPGVDQVLEDLPKDGWLCKIDYRRCFFNIPLHPEMYQYMGIRAPDGSLWQAHRVCFGITTGPHVASIFTAETARIIRSRGVPTQVRPGGFCASCVAAWSVMLNRYTNLLQVYIDDNAVSASSREQCYAFRALALEVINEVGWPVAEDKLKEDAPSQRLAFRGVIFDSVQETMSIPEAKLQATERRVSELLAASGTLSVRSVKSVLGRFGWINQVMPMGRLHVRPIYRSLPFGARNEWKFHLTDEARNELGWWHRFLSDCISAGGVSRWASFAGGMHGPVVRIVSDASGTEGFGGTMLGTVIAGTWAPNAHASAPTSPSIAWKELLPVYLLLREMGPTLAPGTTVVATTDNMPNAFAFNNGSACDGSLPLLALICELAFEYQVRLVGDWIPREFNVLCDLLSRLVPLPGPPPVLRGRLRPLPGEPVLETGTHQL